MIHDPEGDVWKDDFDIDQAATLGCVLSMYSPLVDDVDEIACHLNVMRCALANPKESDDWRRTSIFQTLIKIGGKNCLVIIDSRSCINAVASGMVTKLWLNIILNLNHTKCHG